MLWMISLFSPVPPNLYTYLPANEQQAKELASYLMGRISSTLLLVISYLSHRLVGDWSLRYPPSM